MARRTFGEDPVEAEPLHVVVVPFQAAAEPFQADEEPFLLAAYTAVAWLLAAAFRTWLEEELTSFLAPAAAE